MNASPDGNANVNANVNANFAPDRYDSTCPSTFWQDISMPLGTLLEDARDDRDQHTLPKLMRNARAGP